MASSKKSKEEEEKKKKSNKETKTIKTETKKTITSASKPKKLKSISNESGKNGELEVIIIPSSSCDSQDIQEEKRSEITNQRSEKHAKPNKSKRKAKEENNGEEEEEKVKICVFPMNRIKRIIESDGSDSSCDVVFLINKASEMFIEQFCEDAYECSVQDRKKSLRYKHLSSVVSKQRRYDFLSDFVPEKIKAEDALAEWKSAETGAG